MKSGNRPKFEGTPSIIDRLIILLGRITAVLLLILPWYYFNDLPAEIPRHFDIEGQPDAYGSRSSIWLVTAIAIGLYVALEFLAKKLEIFNYPVKITAVNAQRQYRLAQRLVWTINLIIALIFLYLQIAVIRIALGLAETAGTWILLAIIVAIPLATIIYLIAASQKQAD